MQRILLGFLLVVCLFGLPILGGCQGTVHVKSLDPTIGPVMNRHDVYVQADPNLADVERRTFLRSTEILRQVFDEARDN